VTTRAVLAAYPVLDAWLLSLVVRLWFVRRSVRAEAAWVVAGATAWFLSDLGYVVLPNSPPVLDAGWSLGSIALAASSWAALAARERPARPAAPPSTRPVSLAQLALALVPLAVPGAVQLVATAHGATVDPVPGVVVTVVMAVLAFLRGARLSQQQSVLRQELESRARRAAALADDSADVLVVVDRIGRTSVDGARPALWQAVGEADPAGRQDLLTRAERDPGRICAAELSSGPGTWVTMRAVDRTADPDVRGFVVTLQDATERRRAQDDLAHQAFHDVLTGLPNRALFDDRTTHALARSLRTGAAPVVLSLDLDGFKAVNDTLGHPAGDQLLQQVAARLVAHVRSADTVARLGGDEFAVLLEPRPDGVPDGGPDEHLELAERLVEALGAPYEVAGRPVRVGVSIGVVRAEDDGSSTSATLMRDVDTALYRAKDGGKGRVAVFAPTMRTELLLHTRLRDDVSAALGDGQLRVVYQPVVDLDGGGLQGFEALLRWEHPVLGTVLPTVFIPVAEETGAIVDIGRWVLGEACAAAAGWRVDRPDVTVAVNLSVRQLQSTTLAEDVAAALADTGLAPGALCLELTETALVVDPDQAAVALEGLRALGVRIAVDDFGTGYSSLSHLRRFPVDVLKIDRSFVAALGTDRTAAPVVDGLLELARVMGLDVVAEGVESADQRDHLLAEGCRSAQGWLFSPALERPDADARVAAACSTSLVR
jgi:diguanylate cyclase (GGDEF)-like protein